MADTTNSLFRCSLGFYTKPIFEFWILHRWADCWTNNYRFFRCQIYATKIYVICQNVKQQDYFQLDFACPAMVASWHSDLVLQVANSFRLVHWDVDNENLHGAWFEEATGQHDLLAQMFRDVNQVDPNVKLFINDHMVVKGSISTVVSFGILNKIFINIDVFLKESVSPFSQTVSMFIN